MSDPEQPQQTAPTLEDIQRLDRAISGLDEWAGKLITGRAVPFDVLGAPTIDKSAEIGEGVMAELDTTVDPELLRLHKEREVIAAEWVAQEVQSGRHGKAALTLLELLRRRGLTGDAFAEAMAKPEGAVEQIETAKQPDETQETGPAIEDQTAAGETEEAEGPSLPAFSEDQIDFLTGDSHHDALLPPERKTFTAHVLKKLPGYGPHMEDDSFKMMSNIDLWKAMGLELTGGTNMRLLLSTARRARNDIANYIAKREERDIELVEVRANPTDPKSPVIGIYVRPITPEK